MATASDVIAALARWNRAINTLKSATADILAGRPIAEARQKAEAAIRVGTTDGQIVGQATWFTPPADTQQNWVNALVEYQQALQRAGQLTPTPTPTPTNDGVRIGNVIIPPATLKNMLMFLGIAGAVMLWLWSEKKKHQRGGSRRMW